MEVAEVRIETTENRRDEKENLNLEVGLLIKENSKNIEP
jgi:hypothetical protein